MELIKEIVRESKSASLSTVLDAVFVPGGAFRLERKINEVIPEIDSKKDSFLERNYGFFINFSVELIKTIGYVSLGSYLSQ